MGQGTKNPGLVSLGTCLRGWRSALLAVGVMGMACAPMNDEAASIDYQCETDESALFKFGGTPDSCGYGDPLLPLGEPTWPPDTQLCEVLVSERVSQWDETTLDTQRIGDALIRCKQEWETAVLNTPNETPLPPPPVLKLVANGENTVFVSGPLALDGVVLWIDRGVILYASRDPNNYKLGSSGDLCAMPGINGSTACIDFIRPMGHRPGIIGEGTIDGQGDEPLIGRNYSWWQLSQALRETNGSIGNPNLVSTQSGTTGFLLYRVTIQNAPKFHVKITSNPPASTRGEYVQWNANKTAVENIFVCDQMGRGYTAWGVTIVTPSRWTNSQGIQNTPHLARNTDGIDPGTTADTRCGVIACNTITTSDDQIAIKGGHILDGLVIAHNHFGTGHGISIGSETYGAGPSEGPKVPGVNNVIVYDLTIDGASRAVGEGASIADLNGIRIKSDLSRGGFVTNVTYRDICMRDIPNAVMLLPSYNPLFSGTYYPQFQNITLNNVRHVSCSNPLQSVITLHGMNAGRPMGPVNLDNVVVDGIGPNAVSAQYAELVLGPGPVNFTPVGRGVTLTDLRANGAPKACVFPPLPAPVAPAGWVY
jgi:polygalacturonase